MAGREAFRDQVRDSNDIVEVIGEAVALRPAGTGRFTGLCPFHNETAPSFHVNAERGFFHCFGCKESGDVFGFLMKREGLSFVEALHQLARRAGIPIPETDPKKFSRDERLRAANRKALDFYQRSLRSEAGYPARAYLKKRGLGEDTIAEYGLGFAPDRWDDLTTSLEKSGIDRGTLVEAGLAREGKRGGHHDFFRNRLIVPIFDSQGRAAGFAGRSLDGSEPKYINSPDSPIYRKRSVLYGLHGARSTIRRERSAILFEGYFDCLSAWQAGIAGAVAVCGTALTPDHAKLLAAQTRDVVLAFDADAGGRRATLASLPILLEAQLRVRVAPLSGGRDPDDIIREDGADAFREAIRTAPAFVEFLVEEARQPARASGGRAAAARGIFEIIARAPSPLDREEWLTEAAGSLGFSLESARQEMAQLRSRHSPGSTRGGSAPSPADSAPAATPGPPRGPPTPAERDLIRWADAKPDRVASLLQEADPGELEGFVSSAILLDLKQAADGGGARLADRLRELAAEDSDRQRLLIEIQMEPVGLNTEKQSPGECLDALRILSLRQKLPPLRAAAGGDGEEALAALAELQRISEEIDRLQCGSPPSDRGA
ncbi:MAG: DNA primase [Acidobacteriota bacterium]|nr:DNA primase [Acidobacteriota bacterium]